MFERKPYKVVLESITQEKKKLRSVISYSETSPNGYTFVPVGAPELTEYCKDLSRRKGLDVHVVSAAPKSSARYDPTKISHHIHRIGHHFQNEVVETGCIQLGPTAIARRLDRHGERIGLSTKGNEIDPLRQKEAVSAAIMDLFPKLPSEDKEAIVTRAFEEGSDRIGTQKDVPLPRRVQLAVVAHIRHTKTDYDHLLKTHSWLEARRMVEHLCLEQIVRWRGEDDDEDMDGELEDIFQEVVVLDDDSNEEEYDDHERREASVEIISTRRLAADLSKDSSPQLPLHEPNDARPGIISVKPIRANRPPPLITQDIYQQRFSDAKARVAKSNDPLRRLHPESTSLDEALSRHHFYRPTQRQDTMPSSIASRDVRPYSPVKSQSEWRPRYTFGTGYDANVGNDRYQALHYESYSGRQSMPFRSLPRYADSVEGARGGPDSLRVVDPAPRRRGHEDVLASIEESPTSKWRDAEEYTKAASLAPSGNRHVERYYLEGPSQASWVEPVSTNLPESSFTLSGRSRPETHRTTQGGSWHELHTMPTDRSLGPTIDLTASSPIRSRQSLRFHPYERHSRTLTNRAEHSVMHTRGQVVQPLEEPRGYQLPGKGPIPSVPVSKPVYLMESDMWQQQRPEPALHRAHRPEVYARNGNDPHKRQAYGADLSLGGVPLTTNGARYSQYEPTVPRGQVGTSAPGAFYGEGGGNIARYTYR